MRAADPAAEAASGEIVSVGAVAAIVGGGLRVVSSFIPYRDGSAGLEALYAVIDLSMLFGLTAIYLHLASRIGRIGLVAFIIAIAGLASIVGPDAKAFGVDFYQVGALVMMLGLGVFAVQTLRRGLMAAPAIIWLASVVLVLAASAAGSAVGVLVAGVALGAGFVLAGLGVLRRPQSQTALRSSAPETLTSAPRP